MNVEVTQLELYAKEILRRCFAEADPVVTMQWAKEKIATLGSLTPGDAEALMTWPQSFDLVDAMVDEYERIANTPEKERKVLSWPWPSWRKLIDPLEDGMLGVITAPDGQGKTIYAESIAEYWAEHRNKVVFVHYELNRKLMMLRRTARHTSILTRDIKSGHLTAEQKVKIAMVRPVLIGWDGDISYLHTPGWTMERTIAELTRLHAEGKCDAVVLDYLEKAAASSNQIKLFGAQAYQREADNVEQLKTFSETTGAPVLMVAQMSKEGKGEKIEKVDRTGMRGAGEKSDKANLVILIKRPRTDDGYSNMADVIVDKNTMGNTGQFKQIMQPEYFRVGDMATDSPAAKLNAQSPFPRATAQAPGARNG